MKFKLTKKHFIYIFYGSIAILFLIKLIFPQIARIRKEEKEVAITPSRKLDSIDIYQMRADSIMSSRRNDVRFEYNAEGVLQKHRIYSVPDYDSTFPDSNQIHLATAERLGVKPIKDRIQAEKNKDKLVFVGSSPYFYVKKLYNSIPYLVPRAAVLLEHIARTFQDSLMIKGIPLNTLIVTSLLRSEEDVAKLRKYNGNASNNSCHRYGTTFDIAYNKYKMVEDPDMPKVRPVRDDTLKYVLSEVLRDARKQGLCYVKYEKRQGCYHITTR